jgi:hypothetical protein
MWIDEHVPFAGRWAGQHVVIVPVARAVVASASDSYPFLPVSNGL